MHVLSIDEFSKDSLENLFTIADDFRKKLKNPITRKDLADKYRDQQLCTLFYEPSTRTRLSFEAAGLKLGMGIVSTENAGGFSSAAKGETIEDTIKVINQYDVAAIVMRHPETGAAKRAASVSQTPIVNAGDGKGEHPTQALLDVYTIKRELGRLDNLNIVAGGDLRNGRTIRSLCKVLALYPGNQITFVSLPQLKMQEDILKFLNERGVKYSETTDTASAFKDADVVYWTRLQKERLEQNEDIAGGGFVINKDLMSHLPEKSIVMHPLPRVDEISPDVDGDHRSKYFEQTGNGMYIRMALLDQILSNS